MKQHNLLIFVFLLAIFPSITLANHRASQPGTNASSYLPSITRNVVLTGDVRGQITAAGFDLAVEDASVCALGSSLCTTSDVDGYYQLSGVPVGMQTIQVSAFGFFDQQQTIAVLKDRTSILDFELPRSATLGPVRIVLTWQGRSDLDAHLWLPPTTPMHIDWKNLGDCSLPPYTCLDRDDYDGFGPETMTIQKGLPGNYVYAVYRFSQAGELSWFNPQVEVYDQLGLVVTFNVPASGSGRWWHVFDWLVFDPDLGAGNITPINEITRTSPGPYDPAPDKPSYAAWPQKPAPQPPGEAP